MNDCYKTLARHVIIMCFLKRQCVKGPHCTDSKARVVNLQQLLKVSLEDRWLRKVN